MIRGIIFPTTDGQRPHIQHRAESLAAGFRCEPAQPEMGWRHHLCLDAGRLGLSGGHSRSAFAPSGCPACFARKTLPGNSWAISNRMKKDLAIRALNMAIRCPAAHVYMRDRGPAQAT